MCVYKTAKLKYFLCCLLYVNYLGAQGLSNDSLSQSPGLSYPVRLYFNSIGENAHLYTGYEYPTPDKTIRGTPYFPCHPADMTYDGIYYQKVPILYDIVKDLVVIDRLGQNFTISLISEKLDEFSFENHDFIRLSSDSVHEVELQTGFYDRVYNGTTIVLVKRKKTVQEVLEYSVTSKIFKEEDIYYVVTGGSFNIVNNKTSVLKLFKSKKADIKSYIRKNKLNFKLDFEKTLIATSAYYDQLPS